MLRKTMIAAAAAASGWSAALAVPPPVPVTVAVVAEDPATAETIGGLVAVMTQRGFLAASVAEAPRPDCAVAQAELAACYAAAARATNDPNLVFVLVERSGEPLRLRCIGGVAAGAHGAELSLAAATGDDEAAARPQMYALSGCLLGALHGPPPIHVQEAH